MSPDDAPSFRRSPKAPQRTALQIYNYFLMAKNLKDLFKLKTKLGQALRNIQKDIAVTALNHYKSKFTEGNGAWEGAKWDEPKRKTEGPQKYKTKDKNGRKLKKRSGYLKGRTPRDATRATLVRTGKLSRSIRYKLRKDSILFYSNVPYARRHNEGLKGMPKRQFLGMERTLKAQIDTIIAKNLRKL